MDGIIEAVGFFKSHPEVLIIFTLVQFLLLYLLWKSAKESRIRLRASLEELGEKLERHMIECAGEKGRMHAHIAHEHKPPLPSPLPDKHGR